MNYCRCFVGVVVVVAGVDDVVEYWLRQQQQLIYLYAIVADVAVATAELPLKNTGEDVDGDGDVVGYWRNVLAAVVDVDDADSDHQKLLRTKARMTIRVNWTIDSSVSCLVGRQCWGRVKMMKHCCDYLLKWKYLN